MTNGKSMTVGPATAHAAEIATLLGWMRRARAVSNPYLVAAAVSNFGEVRARWPDPGAWATQLNDQATLMRFEDTLFARDELTARYAWAIPNARALAVLAMHAPLLEVGAGTGYWAHLLRQMGVDILAYDLNPPESLAHTNHYFRTVVPRGKMHATVVGTTWTEVRRGGTHVVARHPDRTLFLCWPPYGGTLAARALACYGGTILLSVGEGVGGCTGDHTFHDRLAREWEEVRSVDIPTWSGLHDYLSVYCRRRETNATTAAHREGDA